MDAISLTERALAYLSKALKPDDTEIATELDNLALYYHRAGRNLEAEPFYKRALAIREKASRRRATDPDSSYKLSVALEKLATFYRDQGRYSDAEPLYQRSLALVEKGALADDRTLPPFLIEMGILYAKQKRYAEAEAFYKRALAVLEKKSGLSDPDMARALNNLGLLYVDQKRYGDALPLVRESILRNTATTAAALPALFGAREQGLLTADEAFDTSLNVLQRAVQSAAGNALNDLAVRFASGTDRLAELVRKDQDLAREAKALDSSLIAAVSAAPSQRDQSAEQLIRDRTAINARGTSTALAVAQRVSIRTSRPMISLIAQAPA